MNYTERVKKMSDRKLKEETYALHEVVNITECFGSKDVTMLEICKRELLNRGYDVDEKLLLSIEK